MPDPRFELKRGCDPLERNPPLTAPRRRLTSFARFSVQQPPLINRNRMRQRLARIDRKPKRPSQPPFPIHPHPVITIRQFDHRPRRQIKRLADRRVGILRQHLHNDRISLRRQLDPPGARLPIEPPTHVRHRNHDERARNRNHGNANRRALCAQNSAPRRRTNGVLSRAPAPRSPSIAFRNLRHRPGPYSVASALAQSVTDSNNLTLPIIQSFPRRGR